MAIYEDQIRELLRKKGRYLYHREGQELEFKAQFNLAGLADYFKDFAAFANNQRYSSSLLVGWFPTTKQW